MARAFRFSYFIFFREEIDWGPCLSQILVNKVRELMIEIGVQCSDVYPVDINIKEESELLETSKELGMFEIFLLKELGVVDLTRHYGNTINSFIRQLEGRINLFIAGQSRKISGKLDKEKYLRGVSNILKAITKIYHPTRGSVPEGMGKLLLKLSSDLIKTYKLDRNIK